ncbi:hypothetical protein Csa_012364 [Cucumis sativus]|nr:hypothetical protein Csa_012364 [Cucumis sativus]
MINLGKMSRTSRMVTIVPIMTMIIATVSIVIVLFPMGADAIPLVGPIAQCIQGCTKSLSTLTPGYCMNLCGAEYSPLANTVKNTALANTVQNIHQEHHVQVEHHHEHHVQVEHHHEHHVQVEHHHEHHVQVEHHHGQHHIHGVN